MEEIRNIKPNRYNHGKVYKLIDSMGFYYIESTVNSLSQKIRRT